MLPGKVSVAPLPRKVSQIVAQFNHMLNLETTGEWSINHYYQACLSQTLSTAL